MDFFKNQNISENYEDIQNIFKNYKEGKLKQASFENFGPFPESKIASHESVDSEIWWEEGLKAVSEGKVACVLLSGGQGTRLGFNYPKGMLDIGLPSKKSIFQLHAEKLIKLENLANKKFNTLSTIPFIIITSYHTTDDIKEFFKIKNNFNINPKNIMIIEQQDFPCLSLKGEIFYSSNKDVITSPAGNGNFFDILNKKYKIIETFENPDINKTDTINSEQFFSKITFLEELIKRGIKYIHIFGVDNVLTRVCDPFFVGFLIKNNFDCAIKVIEKKNPNDKVGIYCKANGIFQAVEYSEMPESVKNEVDEKTDRLVYNTGLICSQLFTIEALKIGARRSSELKYHIAVKKIPHVIDGLLIEPKEPNGIKFEKFIFDVFPFYKECGVFRVDAEDEFSPVKNSDLEGVQCPKTARESVSKYFTKLLKKHCKLENYDESKLVEISSRITYAGEGLEIYDGKVFDVSKNLYLE